MNNDLNNPYTNERFRAAEQHDSERNRDMPEEQPSLELENRNGLFDLCERTYDGPSGPEWEAVKRYARIGKEVEAAYCAMDYERHPNHWLSDTVQAIVEKHTHV